MKQKLIDAYMKTAEIFAECSTARRLHVGAVIVKDNRIISIGYNGMPAGWDNNCEEEYVNEIGDAVLTSKAEVLHAENNAISKLARSTESGENSTMFITHAPCLDCAKLIYQSGINSVYYKNVYRNDSGIQFLEKCKLKIYQLDA